MEIKQRSAPWIGETNKYLPELLRDNLRKFIHRTRKIKFKQNDQKAEKSIIILGCPRSGTSMTARILQSLGVYMSMDDTIASEGNMTGFFESPDFAKVDDKIISKAGGLWYKPPKRVKILKQNILEIQKCINSNQRRIWGWKGTRSCLTIELYHPYLTDPHYIFVERDLDSIAKSIFKGNKFWRSSKINSPEKCKKLAQEYVSRAYDFLKDKKKLMINYDNLVDNTQNEVLKIKKFIGIKKNIDLTFINSKHRHHKK